MRISCFYLRYSSVFLNTNALLGQTIFAMHINRSVRQGIIGVSKEFSTVLRKGEDLKIFLKVGARWEKGGQYLEEGNIFMRES